MGGSSRYSHGIVWGRKCQKQKDKILLEQLPKHKKSYQGVCDLHGAVELLRKTEIYATNHVTNWLSPVLVVRVNIVSSAKLQKGQFIDLMQIWRLLISIN